MNVVGNILKLEGTLDQNNLAHYHFPIGEEKIHLNPLLGKELTLEFTGVINDIYSGEKIKKSYNQGYSYLNFLRLAQCDLCIVKPELCHYHKGTCREPQWGEQNCFIPHLIYLSFSSDFKIGITRSTQIPTRWIDQGAVKGIALAEVKDRRTSGLIEVEIAKEMADKTNWRDLLAKDKKPEGFLAKAIELQNKYRELFLLHEAKILDLKQEQNITYPGSLVKGKIVSHNWDKDPVLKGKLLGIKGQYLIFEGAVINIRKYQGYRINFQYQ